MSTVNAIAKGSGVEIAYIRQTDKDTIPSSGTVYKVKCAGESFDSMLPNEFDSDVSSDGQKIGTVSGLRSTTGALSSLQDEFGAYDDFDLSVLRKSAFTTDTYTDTVATMVGSGDGTTMVITGSGSTDFSTLIVGGPVKLAGTTVSANAVGIFQVVAAAAGAFTVGKTNKDQDFSSISESSIALTVTQRYAKNGSDESVMFVVEKRINQVNTSNGFKRVLGIQGSSSTVNIAAGGAVTRDFSFIGTGNGVASDGIVGPNGWLVDGAQTAGDTTILIKSGATDPAAGDICFIEGDTTNTKYTVVSFATSTMTITPAIRANIGDNDKIFFYRPATNGGVDQKVENNLGYTVIDGSYLCVTSGNINVNNNLSAINCVGDENPTELVPGDRLVSGSIVVNFSTNVQPILTKIAARTRFPISIFCSDILGNVKCFQVPEAVGDEEMVKRADASVLQQNIPFKAEKSSTYGTNYIFHSLAV